jgi:hypothetical protein
VISWYVGSAVVVGAHLVSVDIKHARVASEELQLGIGFHLGAREPVTVHVEAVRVLTRVRLAPVRILRGDDSDDGVVEDLRCRTVSAVGQLVENAQLGVGRTLLAAVHVAHEPEDDGCRARESLRLPGGRLWVAELAQRFLNRGKTSG